jgi:hypothetical protein
MTSKLHERKVAGEKVVSAEHLSAKEVTPVPTPSKTQTKAQVSFSPYLPNAVSTKLEMNCPTVGLLHILFAGLHLSPLHSAQ